MIAFAEIAISLILFLNGFWFESPYRLDIRDDGIVQREEHMAG